MDQLYFAKILIKWMLNFAYLINLNSINLPPVMNEVYLLPSFFIDGSAQGQ